MGRRPDRLGSLGSTISAHSVGSSTEVQRHPYGRHAARRLATGLARAQGERCRVGRRLDRLVGPGRRDERARAAWRSGCSLGRSSNSLKEKPRPHADGTVGIPHALGRRAETLAHRMDARSSTCRRAPIPARSEARRCGMRAQSVNWIPRVRASGYLGNIYQRDAELLFETLLRTKAANARLIMVGDPSCRVPESLASRVMITGRLPFRPRCSTISQPATCSRCHCRIPSPTAGGGPPRSMNMSPLGGRRSPATSATWRASFATTEIGLLVRPEPGEFAARIDELLAEIQRVPAGMGDRAREVARTSYSQEAIADRLEDFYRKTIAARAAREAERRDAQQVNARIDHGRLRIRRAQPDEKAAEGRLLALDRGRLLDRAALRLAWLPAQRSGARSRRASCEYGSAAASSSSTAMRAISLPAGPGWAQLEEPAFGDAFSPGRHRRRPARHRRQPHGCGAGPRARRAVLQLGREQEAGAPALRVLVGGIPRSTSRAGTARVALKESDIQFGGRLGQPDIDLSAGQSSQANTWRGSPTSTTACTRLASGPFQDMVRSRTSAYPVPGRCRAARGET